MRITLPRSSALPAIAALVLSFGTAARADAPLHLSYVARTTEFAALIDTASIHTDGEVTSFDTLMVVDPAKAATEGYAGAYVHMQMKCAAHTSRIIHGRIYGADGSVVGDKDTPEEDYSADDLTAADTAAYYATVCDHKAPAGPTFADQPAAMAWAKTTFGAH